MKIVLASSSIGRKKVLKKLGLKFEAIPADIDEEKITSANPITLVKKIAKAKAIAVLDKLQGAGRHKIYLIIAADSMVVFQGKTFGKPKTKKQATNFLQMLSGKTHEFVTGLCALNTTTAKIYQASHKTKVIFEKLTPKEIEDYINEAPVTSFAGAYSLEEKGAEILRPKIKIIGSESNVLGLPLEKLIPILRANQISLRG